MIETTLIETTSTKIETTSTKIETTSTKIETSIVTETTSIEIISKTNKYKVNALYLRQIYPCLGVDSQLY